MFLMSLILVALSLHDTDDANKKVTRMWADAQRVAALPNIGGALCSTPQRLAEAHY